MATLLLTLMTCSLTVSVDIDCLIDCLLLLTVLIVHDFHNKYINTLTFTLQYRVVSIRKFKEGAIVSLADAAERLKVLEPGNVRAAYIVLSRFYSSRETRARRDDLRAIAVVHAPSVLIMWLSSSNAALCHDTTNPVPSAGLGRISHSHQLRSIDIVKAKIGQGQGLYAICIRPDHKLTNAVRVTGWQDKYSTKC